jgi:hypothetical protein
MGNRRYNALAAQLRLLKARWTSSGSLQDAALDLHQFHVDLLDRPVHFGSYAVDQCKAEGHITHAHHRWAQQLHRKAASARHSITPLRASAAKQFLDIPLPDSAKVVMCADLEGMLNATVWNTGAPVFVPYSGSAHILASPGDSFTLVAATGSTSATHRD